jgi:dGTPase
MEWSALLPKQRLGKSGERSTEASRTTFQRDYDRIVFSSAFRRLHDKTQVFPLPENDHVHSRLTHSLEVSCVGRSLGTMVGQRILDRHPVLAGAMDARDFGDIVAAACLAHDIGNPPFGHAGEDAIGRWFVERGLELYELTEQERFDLLHFEGNAQGFRILTRLQMPTNPGLQLTLATLAAFTKYPRESSSEKKHGFFQAEKELFEAVALGVGLIAREGSRREFCRHPLAFLVEAADDICYSILDLEDGFQIGKVDFAETFDCLAAIAGKDAGYRAPDRDGTKEPIAYLRAKAITRLIFEIGELFAAKEADLLGGRMTAPFADEIPSADDLERIGSLTRAKCYRARDVLEIELAGYEVLHSLLDELIPAALAEKPTAKQSRYLELLPARPAPGATPYQRMLVVTDYLSGMTDSFAVRLFRKTRGMDLG